GGQRLVAMGNIDLISHHPVTVVEKRVEALKREYGDSRVVMASIMGASRERWQGLVRRLEDHGVDLIECSFSCPQGSMGEEPGMMLSQSLDATRRVTGWVKEAASRVPVVIKISPQVTSIVKSALAVKEGGGDGICAANTIPSLMGINVYSRVPHPDVGGLSTYSGMSGPAIKNLTLRTLAEIRRHTGMPITATGGPEGWWDAVECMLVGASTVQFCTAVMHYGFDLLDDLSEGLAYYLHDMGLEHPAQVTDGALAHIVDHDELPRDLDLAAFVDERLCVACDLCHTACRDGGHQAVRLPASGRIPSVDPEACVACALCVNLCPAHAISLQRRESLSPCGGGGAAGAGGGPDHRRAP
ncbi:MAG: 4Fe-4S binding protein, partial [Deltaproteobacteria bacterium]|nr:4Fe-4S binding protein [Deltaproteobacteria bacterium]